MDGFSLWVKHLNYFLNTWARYSNDISKEILFDLEKCHFMVKGSFVLGYKILAQGIQVDQEKIKVMAKLHSPISMKYV